MKNETQKGEMQVILAAGGNPTGIVCMADTSHRDEYATIADGFMKKDSRIEQFGFLEGTGHFQMSGGEFCGNGARAAAYLIAQMTGRKSGTFTMSGFNGRVRYQILPGGIVQCAFDNFKAEITDVVVMGIKAKLVDMGGIVHVVLPPNVRFENKPELYRDFHKKATKELGLGERAAVGVIWQENTDEGTAIHPVVWVKGIDSFFYETACGSGTLATLLVGEVASQEILQPSGEPIFAEKNGDDLTLRSKMSQMG